MYFEKFRIAGLIFQISVPLEVAFCPEFQPFLVENGVPDCVAKFEERQNLTCPEGSLIAHELSFEVLELSGGGWVRRYLDCMDKTRCVALSRTLEDGSVLVEFLPEARQYLKNIGHVFFHIAMEEQLLRYGRWVIHASCVKTPLGVILFVGPSGIGKTTQAELWENHRRSTVLNGDRTIVFRQKEVWYASGSPYAGSSKRYVNECAPICQVVLLEQGKNNDICPLKQGQAFRELYPHLTVNDWNPWYVKTITDQLEYFVKEIPVIRFSCTPDEAAVEALWDELTKEVDHG